jgi:DNA-binding NtrC family response regulator
MISGAFPPIMVPKGGWMSARGIIIGSDSTLRTLCARLLEDVGFSHDDARGSAEADALLSSSVRYDALILDLDAPGGGWISLVRSFRQKFPHALAVVLTDDEGALPFLSVEEANAIVRLEKPFRVDDLLSLLRGRSTP